MLGLAGSREFGQTPGICSLGVSLNNQPQVGVTHRGVLLVICKGDGGKGEIPGEAASLWESVSGLPHERLGQCPEKAGAQGPSGVRSMLTCVMYVLNSRHACIACHGWGLLSCVCYMAHGHSMSSYMWHMSLCVEHDVIGMCSHSGWSLSFPHLCSLVPSDHRTAMHAFLEQYLKN